MNKVFIGGIVTRKSEIREKKDFCMTEYTLAVKRNQKDHTYDFINCVAFNDKALEAAENLNTGSYVSVIGNLYTGSYTRRDGERIFRTDIIVETQEIA